MKSLRTCELCSAGAALHCEADSAFLCFDCDARVHSANFLVARHIRRLACSSCSSLAAGDICGTGSRPDRPLCAACDIDRPASPSSSSSSSSSSCISSSSTKKFAASGGPCRPPSLRRRREAVLARWSRVLGLRVARWYVRTAVQVLEECKEAMAGLPARACLAAALWFAIKACEGRTCENMLRRLEECSGVPGKLIVRVEERLASRSAVAEEGWAECP